MITMMCGRAGGAGAAAGRARGRGFGLGGRACSVVEVRAADAVLVAGVVDTGVDAVLVVMSALVDVDGAVPVGRRRDDAEEEGAAVRGPPVPSSPPITTALTAARIITNIAVVATLAVVALRAWRGAWPAEGAA